MKEDKSSRLQVQKFDAASTFVEVMIDSLSIDKVCINFVSYNKSGAVGDRMSGSIHFYLSVSEAWALGQRIINGRLARARKVSVDKAAAEGSKYPADIYSRMGGTPAARAKRKDGKALSRTFKIAPGTKYPWVLSAECGPGTPGPNGLLIVPDYGYGKPVSKAEMTIRVPMSDDSMDQFACALDTCKQVWAAARFQSLIQPAMDKANDEWKQRVDNAHGSPDVTVYDEDDQSASEKPDSGDAVVLDNGGVVICDDD